MNVCYIITSTIKCGPVNVLYGMVKNYQQIENFNPVIITLKDDDSQKSRRQEFIDLGIEVVQFDMQKDFDKIIEFIEQYNCNIIHSHGLKPDIINNKIYHKFPGKYQHVTTLHNYPFKDYVMGRGIIKGNLMAFLQMHEIKHLNKIACSYAIQKLYREKSRIDVDVVENGVVFPNEIEDLTYMNERPVFLYLGDIRPRKHINKLIDYFALHPEFELWIVGDGACYDEIKQQAHSINNIKLLGRIEDTNPIYQQANYFISDSVAEGLPMSALEALSNGTPLILSDIDPHKEVLSKVKNAGIIFKLDNLDDLNNKVQKLLEMKFDRFEIQKEARKYFSSDRMMNEYLKKYLEEVKEK